MPLSSYGRNFYADLIVGIESSPPAMWMVLTSVSVTSSDDGSTITEASPRFQLLPGSGTWAQTSEGLRTYTGTTDYFLEESYDPWGLVVGYAIVDSLTAGTGNVLFYGSITPTEMIGPMVITFDDLAIEVPA
jgi:hypothetical protein